MLYYIFLQASLLQTVPSFSYSVPVDERLLEEAYCTHLNYQMLAITPVTTLPIVTYCSYTHQVRVVICSAR